MTKEISVSNIKKIIEKVIDGEIKLDRKEFPLRLNKIRDEIFFKIDNPNYIRKVNK